MQRAKTEYLCSSIQLLPPTNHRFVTLQKCNSPADGQTRTGILELLSQANEAMKHRWERFYQLDFVTPGIIPWEASSRNAMRDSRKRRMNPRRRPLCWQRLMRRVGLASRGSWASPS